MTDWNTEALRYEHTFDPEHDEYARRVQALAGDDAIVRSAMDDWRFGRITRTEALTRALERLSQRCAALERLTHQAPRR